MPWCCPAPLVCGDQSDEAEHGSGIGLKLLGFIGNRCSYSSRIAVRNHPGLAFGIVPESRSLPPRIPSCCCFVLMDDNSPGSCSDD
jgi:hypothetical protein